MTRTLAAVCAVSLLAGCGFRPALCIRTPSDFGYPTASMAAGASVRFVAGRQDFLHECDLEAPRGVRWSTSDSSVATIDRHGMLRALAPGRTDVVARVRWVETRTTVTVVQVSAIRFSPTDTTLRMSDSVLIRAVAVDAGGAAIPDAVLHLGFSIGAPSSADSGRVMVANGDRRVEPNGLWLRGVVPGRVYVVGDLVGFRDSTSLHVTEPE